MSNTTTVAMAAAMAMTLAAVQPAEAMGNKGLSRTQIKQVRTIAQQEVARIPRVQGPAGPAGPAGPEGPPGMDGAQGAALRFAEIAPGGFVGRARGISQENVVADRIQNPNDPDRFHGYYCVVGLPPPLGAQVSSGIDVSDLEPSDEQILFTEDGVCIVDDSDLDDTKQTSFNLLLLY